MVQVGSSFIFQYEASRPDAASNQAGVDARGPCSRAGVLPWTRVTQSDAAAACAAIADSTGTPLRLCSAAEWTTACNLGNANGAVWSFATNPTVYDGMTCNGADHALGAAGPTGSTASCYANQPGGRIYDLSGNVAEWTATPVNTLNETSVAVRGGAYNTLAAGLSCNADFLTLLPSACLDALGFRCCADHAPLGFVTPTPVPATAMASATPTRSRTVSPTASFTLAPTAAPAPTFTRSATATLRRITFTPTATPTPSPTPMATRRPVITLLVTPIGPTITTIPVANINAFPSSGTVQIGNELMTYNGVLATSSAASGATSGAAALVVGAAAQQPGELLNVQRGVNGTTPTAHSLGDSVTLVTSSCVGDCTNSTDVTGGEIITMMNIALGNLPVSACYAGDASDDGQITVDEMLKAVNNALSSCEPRGPTALTRWLPSLAGPTAW